MLEKLDFEILSIIKYLSLTNKVSHLELGWAAGPVLFPLTQFFPLQSVMVVFLSTSSSIPSQYTPPSLVDATLVNIVFLKMVSMAIGLLLLEVPKINFILFIEFIEILYVFICRLTVKYEIKS